MVYVILYLLGALITSVISYYKDRSDLETSVVIGILWFFMVPYYGLRWATKKVVKLVDEAAEIYDFKTKPIEVKTKKE